MKRKRYSDGQIIFTLRQAEGGMAVEGICRKLGVSKPTFQRWRKQFAGMGTVEIRRLKQLEKENAKLKRLVADLSLDKTMLQNVLRKTVRPGVRREVVGALQGAYQVSERRACSATGFGRSSHRYRSRRAIPFAAAQAGKDNPNAGGTDAKNIHRALDASLKQRGTDYIDPYRMHIWDGVTPVDEIVHTPGNLVRAGKIRY